MITTTSSLEDTSENTRQQQWQSLRVFNSLRVKEWYSDYWWSHFHFEQMLSHFDQLTGGVGDKDQLRQVTFQLIFVSK